MACRLSEGHSTKILVLSWRDIKAPKKGGAEIYTHEVLRGAVQRGMHIVHFSPLFKGGTAEEEIDGVKYIRRGGTFSVILHALRYYISNRNKFDFVIDQCNTHRYFTKYWVERDKRIFLIFQLTCNIWDYQMSWPFNWIGKQLEKPMLRLSKKDITITESQSTKDDLIHVGFETDRIHIIPVGLSNDP